MELFHPALLPFTAALIVLGLIATLELVGLLFGVAFSGLVDSALPDIELDADADFEMDAELGGDGGVVVIDGEGQYEYVFNSKGMYRGMIDPDGMETAIFEQE